MSVYKKREGEMGWILWAKVKRKISFNQISTTNKTTPIITTHRFMTFPLFNKRSNLHHISQCVAVICSQEEGCHRRNLFATFVGRHEYGTVTSKEETK